MNVGSESFLEDDNSEQLSATTMTPNTQKAHNSLWVSRLHSPKQPIYHYQPNAGQEICRCKDVAKIFERSVEEQCSDVWYSDTSEEDKSDLEHDNDPPKSADGTETQGAREDLQTSNSVSSGTEGNNYTRGSSMSKSLSSSSGGSNKKAHICVKGHKIKPRRNRSRSAFDLEELALSRPWAGSIIHQFSRQTTRQSAVGCYAVGGPNNRINSEGSTAEEPICLAMSRSSFTAIPTHVYSLEKYVSTELDSATETFFDKDVKIADISPSDGQSSIMSPSFPSSSSLSFASSSSNSNVADKISPPPLFLDQRKRRQSHIELSLAEYFQ